MAFIITICSRLCKRRIDLDLCINKTSVQSIIQTVFWYERLKDFVKNYFMTGEDGQQWCENVIH